MMRIRRRNGAPAGGIAQRLVRPGGWRVVAAGAALVLVPGLVAMTPVPNDGGGLSGPAQLQPRPVPRTKPVPVRAVPHGGLRRPPVKSWHPPATVWPAPGAGTAVLPAASTGAPSVARGAR